MVAILDECGYSSIELVLAAVEGLPWLHVVASSCLTNKEDRPSPSLSFDLFIL